MYCSLSLSPLSLSTLKNHNGKLLRNLPNSNRQIPRVPYSSLQPQYFYFHPTAMNHQPLAKPSPNPLPASNNGRSASECGNCGSQKRWILHHVRIRGIHRRLCTSCVLRLHPSSFCPSCFQFYDNANVPPSSKRLTCSKCSSFTHSHCAPPPAASAAAAAAVTSPLSSSSSSSNSYLCPPCASPSFNFFDIDSDPNRAIDKKLALVLLCAAKISAASMNKAVIVARAEAERRVREAALARKRAREALDNLALLVSGRGGKAVRKDAAAIEGSVSDVSASANSAQKLQKEKSFPVPSPNPHGRQQNFNGFSAPRQSPAAAVGSPTVKKTENGEVEAVNGNVNGKDKPGILDVKKEKVDTETKSDVPPK